MTHAVNENENLLELRKVTTHYGAIRVLHDVDMVIHPGEMVRPLGGPASGESTTLKTILGVVRVSEGEMHFRGERAETLTTAQRIERGMAEVPENRRNFPRMTVRENLEMVAYLRNDRQAIREDMDYVISLFPASAIGWGSRAAPCPAASSRCWRRAVP